MSIPGAANPLLLRTAAAGGYQISRSLRFNSSDSAKCARTYSTGSSTTTQTFSAWVKRAKLGATGCFWSGYDGSAAYGAYFQFDSADTITVILGGASLYQLTTTQVFRDPSSWYHIVLTIDTNNGTNSDRIRLYVNGSRVTTFSTASYPTSGYACQFAMGNANNTIGTTWGSSGYSFFDGYLADVHFIDGQALDPSAFVAVSATTGRLEPKQYTGSFGTNGFWLKFSDNSAATATTLGKDYSGNNNNWSPTNLSVTAGAGNDSLTDTPTSYGTDDGLGGSVRGNYATLNPLAGASGATLSNGNLDRAGGAGNKQSTIGMSSGKWYWEVTVTDASTLLSIGVTEYASDPSSYALNYSYASNGSKWIGTSNNSYGASYTAGDVIGFALDMDNGNLVAYKNGSSQGTLVSSLTGKTLFANLRSDGTCGMSANFGQRPFAYPVSGYKCLCDTSLPSPVVAKSASAFDVKLWNGNSGTQNITGLAFSPDLAWVKGRVGTLNHVLSDTIRGANLKLASNTTGAEAGTDNGTISAFNSDGISVAMGTGTYAGYETNLSGYSYVGWFWDAGTSTVTNTQGSITSQVRANASAGFSVATLTTPSSGNFTVGHGLNIAPSLVICKARNQAFTWIVYHKSAGAGNALVLNTTAASTASSTVWQNTDPSSTLVYGNASNWGTADYVMYSFAPVAGYSSFGSYTGNGSADGPFVYTGFRPKFVLIKGSSFVSNWNLLDGVRDSYNVADKILRPNLSNAELNSISAGSGFAADFLSNGFKLRASLGDSNSNAETFVWAAFAESPFAYSRAR